jgi:hypothetical protein
MRLLAISYAFPPLIAPRSIQVARLLRHLDAESALVCGSSEGERLDPTIEPDAASELATWVRPERNRTWLRRRADGLAYRLNVPLWNRHPDEYRHWMPAALAGARSILQAGFAPDVIVSFGNPMTDHLIGRELARETGLPWVAHFSDPWTRNPFQHRRPVDELFNARLERSVLGSANLLLFPSAECAEHVLEGQPDAVRARAQVLPHSYEPMSHADEGPVRADGKLVIRHVGTLYAPRRIGPVVQALLGIASELPTLLDRVRFEFVGARERDSLADPDLERLPAGVCTAHDGVPYAESLRLMRDADGLLLLDGKGTGKGIFFPSKLADYIGAGRPILGISAPGAAAGIISRLGGVVADVEDQAAITAGMRRFLLMLAERSHTADAVWGHPAERQRYAAPQVAALFREQLDRVACPQGQLRVPLARSGLASYLPTSPLT